MHWVGLSHRCNHHSIFVFRLAAAMFRWSKTKVNGGNCAAIHAFHQRIIQI